MICMPSYVIVFFQVTAWMTVPLIPAGFFLEEDEVAAAVLHIDGKCYVVCISIWM